MVRPGLPAHVTILYPFLLVTELTGDIERAVGDIAAATPVTDVHLTELVTAPGFVAAAAPALQPVADAVCARWPDVRPYGGRFGPRPATHLTVAMSAKDAEIAQVSAEVRRWLPVHDRADALHLVILTEHGWRRRLTAPFNAGVGMSSR